jgi:hypothetical protein
MQIQRKVDIQTNSVPHGMLVKRASLLLDVVDGRVTSIDVPAETLDKYGEERGIVQMDDKTSKKQRAGVPIK